MVVHYFSSGQGEHYQSVKDKEGDDTMQFLAGGEVRETPNGTVVSLTSAIECVKHFFEMHERPSFIQWDEI